VKRILVNPHRNDTEVQKFSQVIGSQITYKVDFSVSADVNGTTVSGVAWSSQGAREVTVSNTSLSSGVASAKISSEYSGEGLVRVRATYADGTTENQYLRIDVHDPEYQATG